MLAGSLLYDISGKGIDQAGRLIREQDAIPLVSVNKLCRVDVETIIAKALEKDKARLYETTADPAGDIDCYLTDRPIRARLPGTGYQLQKIGAATVLLALVARTAVRICEAIQARRAQQSAQAANDFLKNDLLAQASVKLQANTNNRADPDLKVRTTFDRAAQRINGKFGAQPRGFGLVLPVEEQLPSIGDPMPCA